MASHSHAAPHGQFDQIDPHHSGTGHDHGHVILSRTTLGVVLAVLLMLTALTVGATLVETWLIYDMGVHLPRWVNVVVALSIALVKGALVCLYFMQLRYDNPINSIIFLFCLFAVALFLGLTLMDLGNRHTVYAYKAEQIQAGGMGIWVGDARHQTGGKAIVDAARARFIEKHGVEKFNEGLAKAQAKRYKKKHGEYPAVVLPTSTADRSRPRSGITEGLFSEAPAAPAAAGH